MAIVAMEQIRLLAMNRDRKAVLDLLQRRGIIDVSDEACQGDIFEKTDASDMRLALSKDRETAVRAVALLDKYAGTKGPSLAFLRGREAKNLKESESIAQQEEESIALARRIVQLDQEIREADAAVARLNMELASLTPWLSLPVPQTFAGTDRTAAFIGVFEGECPREKIMEKLMAAAPELDTLHLDIISINKSQTCVMAIVPKRLHAAAEDALRAVGFAKPPAAGGLMPTEEKERLERELAEVGKAVSAAKAELESYGGARTDLCYLQDWYEIQTDKSEITDRLIQSPHVFVLSGYVPQENAATIEGELLSRFDCHVERTPAERPGDAVPVLLKNNWFAEAAEGIVESYSMPGQADIDPTGIMSIFYFLMFGLMFGDAGYGFIMALVCGICLLKFKNMEPNWSKNIRMFFWCGVATVFWGVIFSSYFGNAVDVISETFFGVTVSIPPVWFYIDQKPMLMLVFCLGLGILHLTVGFIMKGITDVKNGDKFGVVSDTVFPVLLWYSLMALLANSDMFFDLAGFRLPLSSLATQICQGAAGVAAVGIILTGGRGTKNWVLRLLQGLYATYNTLSGWLGDMLSYSRLLALGLASGVIANVMNQLGGMAGNGVAGVIVFVLVFALGHAMNFGINVLGAYVHSNRLEYIEFFGKFYDGGGRKFSPFGIRTKYYKIEEEH